MFSRLRKPDPLFVPAKGHEKRFFLKNFNKYFGESATLKACTEASSGNEGFELRVHLDHQHKLTLVARMRHDSRKDYLYSIGRTEGQLKPEVYDARFHVNPAAPYFRRTAPQYLTTEFYNPANTHTAAERHYTPDSYYDAPYEHLPQLRLTRSEPSSPLVGPYPARTSSMIPVAMMGNGGGYNDEPVEYEENHFQTAAAHEYDIPALHIRAPTLEYPQRQPALRPSRSTGDLGLVDLSIISGGYYGYPD